MACLSVVALVGGCTALDTRVAAPHIDLRDAAAYAALPVAQLHAAAPLCAKIVACVAPARPHAVIDRDGDVVLTMASDRRTVVGRVFAGSDSAVRVGGEGGGPGEYRTPDVLGIAPNGDALVFDGVARRLLAFAPDGTVRSTGAVRFPPAPLEGLGFVRGVLRMLSTGAPRTAGDSLPVHVFTLEGGSRAARRQHALSLRQPAYGLTELRAPPPVFAARDFFALREDGSVAFAAGARAVLWLFDSTGALTTRVGFTLEPRKPSDAEVAQAVTARLRGIPPGPMRREAERQLSRPPAAHLPLVTNMVAMGDGEIWLRGSPGPDGATVEWIVFAPDGTPFRRVRSPADDAVLGKHGERYLVSRAEPDANRYWWMTLR